MIQVTFGDKKETILEIDRTGLSLAHAWFVSGYTLGIPLGIVQHPPCSVRSMCMRVQTDYDVG